MEELLELKARLIDGDVMTYPTPLLDQILAQRRQANEETRLALQQQVFTWLDRHAHHYGISGAYLFGSILRPYQFTPRSDLDLAVTTVDPAQFFSLIGTLSEEFGRDVDVVELKKCPFAPQIQQRGLLWTPPPSPSSKPISTPNASPLSGSSPS